MALNLHIVFPKEYKEVLLSEMGKKGYKITNFDHSLETFHHWSVSHEKTQADVALIAESFSGNIPMENKVQEFIEKLTEIRIARSSLRLVIVMPTEFNHIVQLKEQLVKLGVYDFHFFDNFSFDDLLGLIEKPKSLADVKQYIQIDTATKGDIEKALEKHAAEKLSEMEEEPKTRIEKLQQRRPIVQKVIEQQIVERVVEISQKSIAFHSLSRGAGSTFHSLNLGSYLSGKKIKVGIYENPVYQEGRTYQADALSLFTKPGYLSAPHQVVKRLPVFQEQVPSADNINFYSLDPTHDQLPFFEYENYLRYLNLGKETIKIMDFGYIPFHQYSEEWFQAILSTFDLHIVCIDLMPLSLIPNTNRLSWFINNKLNLKVQFFINKFCGKVSRGDLEDMGLEEETTIPYLNRDDVFNSYYQNKLPFKFDEDINEILSPIYDGIYTDIGFELVGTNPNKKGLLSRFRSKNKQGIF